MGDSNILPGEQIIKRIDRLGICLEYDQAGSSRWFKKCLNSSEYSAFFTNNYLILLDVGLGWREIAEREIKSRNLKPGKDDISVLIKVVSGVIDTYIQNKWPTLESVLESPSDKIVLTRQNIQLENNVKLKRRFFPLAPLIIISYSSRNYTFDMSGRDFKNFVLVFNNWLKN